MVGITDAYTPFVQRPALAANRDPKRKFISVDFPLLCGPKTDTNSGFPADLRPPGPAVGSAAGAVETGERLPEIMFMNPAPSPDLVSEALAAAARGGGTGFAPT